MIKFDNDYSKSAHPVILDVLTKDAKNSHTGYGLDTWCKRATAEIRRATGSPTADVHYLVGGTQTNMTIIVIMYFFYLLSKLFSINNAENDKKYRCLSDFSLNEALCAV